MGNIHIFHEFEIDKAIITDLIYSQNGTISTALRELVMNAIDAKSKRCDIQLNTHSFSVSDNGCGFKSRESIEQVFKRFGEPHEDGDATFGRFRIGRGQIMSFGTITWHSNGFKMHTDVQRRGNGFELEELQFKEDHYDGCCVSGTFYNELDSWDISHVKKDLAKLVKYADLIVTINGIDITLTESTIWDIDDDDVKIKWSPDCRDGIHLYSLGVYVKNIERYRYGLNADIVTKRALKLNMARNEISDIDPLWKIIDGHLKAQSLLIANNKNKRMTEDTRKSVICQLINNEVSLVEVLNLPLLRDCRGQCISFKALFSRSFPIAIVSEKSRLADMIATQKTALILHHDELRIWEVNSLQEWQTLLIKLAHDHSDWIMNNILDLRLVDFNALIVGISHSLTILKTSELSAKIAAGKNALTLASKIMSKRITKHGDESIATRKILVGSSAVADGWTDGISYIAVNDKMIKLLDSGYYGAVQLAMLLLHEYCHDKHDGGSHEHDFAFYERFHNLSSACNNEIIGHTATSMFKRYQEELINKNQSLPNEIIRNFKYPVVNQTIALTGILEGSLTPLAKKILDISPVNYRIRGNAIHIVCQSWNDEQYRKIPRYIESMIKESGIKIPDKTFIRQMAVDHSTAYDLIEKEWDKVYNEYILTENIDLSFLKQLHKCSCPKSLFRALCADTTGLKSFEYNSLLNTRTIGTATCLHSFRVRNYQLDKTSSIEFAKSKALRTEYAISGIKQIVDGIIDKAERESFMQTFLTINAKNQINQ